MSQEIPNKSSVLIVDQSQDHKGVLTNAAFVLGLSAGKLLPSDTYGADVVDGNGEAHRALTKIAHFVRKASQSKIRGLRETFSKNSDTVVIDYTEDAAPSNYEAYTQELGKHKGEEIKYRALYVYGPTELVYSLTKNLSRLE